MSKKLLSLVLALVIVLGSFSTVFAASYNDVEAGTTVADAVDRLSTLGILTGYKDGSFKPENQITRAEFAAVAVRAKGLEDAANAAKGLATGFTDVAPAPAHWAAGYVGTAARLGIVNGVGGGLFAPEAPVKYEEAITMIVRALGYEAAAQTKGGYPYGYLIVANEIGLDQVKGTQGTPATRGIVAQITDNALEIPMMIQVGFGADAKWVVSGSREHGDNAQERYLLDELGFDSVEGRSDVSSNKKRITVNIEDEDEQDRVGKKSVALDVNGNVDLYEVDGLLTKYWHKDGEIIIYVVKDEAKFDAVAYDKKDEITLITEDENYEVVKKAELIVDGDDVDELKDLKADYAKVVLNEYDEVISVEGYSLKDFLVVEEVKDNKILGYDEYELNVKGYTIVKDGKTIAVEDLEDGDVVFYNKGEEFAVVTTLTKTGKIDRVYIADNAFRFDGKTYNVDAIGAKYFDGEELIDIDSDLLDELEKDADEVTLFFNFANKVAVVAGVDKDVKSSSFYAVLLNNAANTEGRRGQSYVSIDVRDQDGNKKLYDLDFDVLNDSKLLKSDVTSTSFAGVADLKADADLKLTGDVIKITVDEDGDVTEIAIPSGPATLTKDFKITDTYVKAGNDFKATSKTAVFYNSNKKAITLGEIDDEFEVVKEGSVVFYEKGNAVAIVGDTNADADTKTVVGLLNSVKQLSSKAYEIKVKVAGTTETYVSDSTTAPLPSGIKVGDKNYIVELEIGVKSGKVAIEGGKVDIAKVTGSRAPVVTIDSVSSRKLTTTTGAEYGLVDGYVIYDAADGYSVVRDVRDLVNKSVTIYFEANSNYYVAYIVANLGTGGGSDVTGVVTYINNDKENAAFAVDGKLVEVTRSMVLKEGNSIIASGNDIVTVLKEGDQVTIDGNVITRKSTEESRVEAVIFALPKAANVKYSDKAAIEAARKAYKDYTDALPVGARDLVSAAAVNYLVAAEGALQDILDMDVTGVGARFDGTNYYGELVLVNATVEDVEKIELDLYQGTTLQATITATEEVFDELSALSTVGGSFIAGDEYWSFTGEVGTGTSAPNVIVAKVTFASGKVVEVSSTTFAE